MRTASALKFSLALFLLWVGYTNIDRFKNAPLSEPFETEDSQWDMDSLAYSHLLDVALVASVDGSFHLLQRSTGHSRWSIASEDKTLLPLVNTSQPSNSDESQEQYIIEPQSGDIYVLASPPETSSLRRFPYSMPQLVDMSPFTFDDLLFVGEKETFELTIDLDTGHFKTSSGADSWREAWLKAGDFGNLTPEQIAHMGFGGAQEVSIGRTAYRVAVHKRVSEKETIVQNLAFSTYGPHNENSQLQAAYTKTGDDVYVQGLPSGEIMAFKVGALRWASKLTSPMIAAFDAMNPPGVHIPEDFTALLQPRLPMSIILPQSEEVVPSHPGPGLVYIGLIEETCSLFAMSPERFPLIAMDSVGPSRRQQPDLDATSPDVRTRSPGRQQAEDGPPSAESWDQCAEQRRLVGMRRIEDEDDSAMRAKWLPVVEIV